MMGDVTAWRHHRPVQPLTLLLALLLGIDRAWENAVTKPCVNITVVKRTVQEKGRFEKAVNISCFVDPDVASLIEISLDRRLLENDIPRQQLVEAKSDLNEGLAGAGRDSAKKSSRAYELQGGVHLRWVSLVLSAFTIADDGEYFCFGIFKLNSSKQMLSYESSYLIISEELWGSAALHANVGMDLGSWWWIAFKAGSFTFLAVMTLFVIGVAVVRRIGQKKSQGQLSSARTPAPVGRTKPAQPKVGVSSARRALQLSRYGERSTEL